MEIQIPSTHKKRVVIVGGGFGGLALANKLDSKLFQVVLIDKFNYHQFQPLLYQVVSSGLEPSSISFPFRKLFAGKKSVYFRMAELLEVHQDANTIDTSIGTLTYDYLVLATGTVTNFFGNEVIQHSAYSMKSVEEALVLKNALLINLEKALDTTDQQKKQALLNVVVVGGGASGVEVAGALSEMKRYVLKKDYPDLKGSTMNIYLIEGSPKVLGVMSDYSSSNALRALKEMGVNVILNRRVVNYEDHIVYMDDGQTIQSETLIWVSGVTSEHFSAFPTESVGRGGRLLVDEFNRVKGYTNIFAIGDTCLQQEADYPNGHPQVAPVAIQQGRLLAKNLKNMKEGKEMKAFRYHNQGTLATIGRNRAVADLKKLHIRGFVACAVWMLVHLRSILGVRNKIMVLLDWVWNYFTYDQSLRFIWFVDKKKGV